MIRLLVVEDSKTVQKLLVAAFAADPQIQVVGTAESGEAAVSAAVSVPSMAVRAAAIAASASPLSWAEILSPPSDRVFSV